MTMKLISDDTLNSNLTTSNILLMLENNYSEQKNNYINNSIFHYNKNNNNKNKQEIPVIPIGSNIYYKCYYQNNTNPIPTLNEFNKSSNPQNLKKIYDQNMYPSKKLLTFTSIFLINILKHQRKIFFFYILFNLLIKNVDTYEKTLVEMNSNLLYQNSNNIEKKLFSYNDIIQQPQKV